MEYLTWGSYLHILVKCLANAAQEREENAIRAKLEAVDRLKQLSRTLIACERSMTLNYPFIRLSHLTGIEEEPKIIHNLFFISAPSHCSVSKRNFISGRQPSSSYSGKFAIAARRGVRTHFRGFSGRFSSEITWTCPLTVQLDQSVASSQAQRHAGGLQTVAGHLWNNDSIMASTSAGKWLWLHPSVQKYTFVCVCVCVCVLMWSHASGLVKTWV